MNDKNTVALKDMLLANLVYDGQVMIRDRMLHEHVFYS